MLFDTLPVFMAYSDDYVLLEQVHVSIDSEGVVTESTDGRPALAATNWRNFDGYLDHLTERLLGSPTPEP